MFERCAPKGIKVIMLAQEEARRLGHNFTGTEQLLLGTLGADKGILPLLLPELCLKTARDEVERMIGRGSGFVAVDIPFTPRAHSALKIINANAIEGKCQVYPLHILRGLLELGEGNAIIALTNLGIDTKRLLETTMIHMDDASDLELVTYTKASYTGEVGNGSIEILYATPPDGNKDNIRFIDINYLPKVSDENPVPTDISGLLVHHDRKSFFKDLSAILRGRSKSNIKSIARQLSDVGSILALLSEPDDNA